MISRNSVLDHESSIYGRGATWLHTFPNFPCECRLSAKKLSCHRDAVDSTIHLFNVRRI